LNERRRVEAGWAMFWTLSAIALLAVIVLYARV
jgi:hypothetical protein